MQQKSIELIKCESMVHRNEKKRLHCDRRQAWMEPFQCFVLKKNSTITVQSNNTGVQYGDTNVFFVGMQCARLF